ncbi:N-acetylmuramic acid 6-phosphate etherase [Lacticaseibacillus saniviri]|uniref:N-acetylmuramic acid 6-phosphate etherase n=1 Tax=Lacticaseibacillus saniviri JCM 17471 = DSM 24301 TaxID=1293598 RepID=A0A0R2MPF1_9LACO|nr:N-acetylmuramic acid 6-phosphate etherase [Lacticaseibacillus saniviri]KRO15534.1 N-acetylmuramic acid 6-phosphate etherase [Lacticaseibacillus saniviri JCM 17471 = DSM 24301]MCG4281644.1 N-acetylmuramic acid 6-phosphate etherase [Lacticaseibacillus saniviri]
MDDIKKLATEARNPETTDLDLMTPLQMVTVMNQQDQGVAKAVEKVLPQIAASVEVITKALKENGRLFYIGAGTSGRLGVLDAAECVPTFGTDPETVQGLIAGGASAMTVAVEGAEDDLQLAKTDLSARHLTQQDVVVGIAASGRTPYVIGGLDYARTLGTPTIALACNADSVIGKHADIAIDVVTGPEVLSGSTRLKAGTAQKMVLNMLSTASMVGIGKTYGNLMVDVKPTNEKLVERAKNIIMTIAEVDRETATRAFEATNGSVKLAIVMLLNHDDSVAIAQQQLSDADDFVRRATNR